MMKWRGFGRERSGSNGVTTQTLERRDYGKSRNLSAGIADVPVEIRNEYHAKPTHSDIVYL
jgi:hypothetical protein